jgi:hypothetical protein
MDGLFLEIGQLTTRDVFYFFLLSFGLKLSLKSRRPTMVLDLVIDKIQNDQL